MSIDLIGPDGKEYAFDGDEAALANAKANGFRVASEIGVVESALDTAKAAGLGVVQGFTAGLYGAGAGSAQGDEEPPESAQARWAQAAELQRTEEEHPVAATLGEVAGMVLSPVNKAAPAVEGARAATTAGRLLQNVKGGAAVGSLFGAGSALSDAALGDAPLTAEKLVATAGLGALLGGMGGGFGGAIAEGAAKVLPKLSTVLKGGQSTLDSIADDFALKSFRNTKTELAKLSEQQLAEVARVTRERGHLKLSPEEMLLSIGKDRDAASAALLKEMGVDTGKLTGRMGAEDARAALDAVRSTHGEKIGAALKEIDDLGWARPEYSRFRQRFESFKDGLNAAERDNIKGELGRVQGFLDELGAKPVGKGNGFADVNSIKSTLQKEINYKVDDNVRIDLKKKLVGILRDEIDSQIEAQVGGRLSKEFVASKRSFGLLSRAEDALGRASSTGDDAITALADELGHASPARALADALRDAEKLAAKGSLRPGGFSLGDIGAAVIGGNLHPLGIAASLGSKFIREHGPAVIARVADTLAKSPALSTVAQSFAKALPATAPKLGTYGPALLLAAQKGPTFALAQHIVTAQADPEYAANAQMAGLVPESPDEHEAALGRATDLAAMHAAMKSHDEAIGEGLEHVIKGTKPASSPAVLKTQDFGARRMHTESREAHQKRVEEVRRLATDPQALVDAVAKNTLELGAAPGVTGHLTAVADRAVKYLASQAEVPPKPGPLAREWTPTDAERHTFALKLEAVQQPMSVLAHAAKGTLTQLQLDAVAAVYPAFRAQLQERALERLVSGEPVPYRARLMLAMLSGVDPDGTLSPRSIAMNQRAIAGAQGKPSERMPAPTSEVKLGQADRMALPGEKRQLGSETA